MRLLTCGHARALGQEGRLREVVDQGGVIEGLRGRLNARCRRLRMALSGRSLGQLLAACGRSRLRSGPVFEELLDHVVGVLAAFLALRSIYSSSRMTAGCLVLEL